VPEYIDLGSPSELSESEDDDAPANGICTTPPSDHNKQEPNAHPYLLESDPIIADTIEAPGPAVAATALTTIRSQAPLGDVPEHASIATVGRWSWSQLEDTQDRKRIVSKAIYEMSSIDKETMRERLQQVGRVQMIRQFSACVDMLLRGDKRMPRILPQDLSKIVTFTELFLCWWLCGNYFKEKPPQPRLEELATCLRQHSPDPATFCDYVDTVLSTTFSRAALSNPMQPSQAEVIEISDDDEPLPQASQQRKRNVDRPGSLQKSTAIVVD